MYLLDSNVVSEMRKIPEGEADVNVARWVSQSRLNQSFLSVITVFESKRGVVHIRRHDPRQADLYQRWLNVCLEQKFAGRILPISIPIVLQCAEFKIASHKEFPDALLAATALHHGLIVVTRNVRHFHDRGVKILNPWEQFSLIRTHG